MERLATGTPPVRPVTPKPKPSFDPPMSAEDEEKVDFNLWEAGIPALQIFPPLKHYASGRVRALTRKEAHALYIKEQGEEAYVEFQKRFNKAKDLKTNAAKPKPKPKKRKASASPGASPRAPRILRPPRAASGVLIQLPHTATAQLMKRKASSDAQSRTPKRRA